MAEQVDVPYMVRSNVASGGAYNYAASQGIPSILIERGGMGAWTSEEVRSTRRDVRNILCHLGIYQGKRITELIILWTLQISVIRTLPGTGCGIPLKSPAI